MKLQQKLSSLSRPKPPKHISKRFRQIDSETRNEFTNLLKKSYFNKGDSVGQNYLSTDVGKNDLQSHVYSRLDFNRTLVVPWIDSVRSIDKANILEIGCGTGSSTVALAEQGAQVTAIDIDRDSLIVAKKRCEMYGLDVNLIEANATQAKEIFRDAHFHFVIFYASLEHMLHQERIKAIRDTWNMLSNDDLWCILEAPNRLWYYDNHTSQLPFFMWLPDDLAFEYSRFSPRPSFSELYRELNDASMREFLRRGRGISFHEFELAMKPIQELNVISDLSAYRRRTNIFYSLYFRRNELQYKRFLSKVLPKVPSGFYERLLNLIIKKD